MIELNRWNYETQQYDKVQYDDTNLNFKLFTSNMKEIVNCPHCKKQFCYGDGYTSMEFHNHYGLGYPVCEECYDKEWSRRNEYNKRN